MPLDHYVSQVHLKQFFSPALGSRLFATKKSDLKSFQCHSRDVCRIEAGSTNAYLINERAIEEFLRSVEPHYDVAIANLRQSTIDANAMAIIAGFTAYVTCCAPAAMRIHIRPQEEMLKSVANIMDRRGVIERAPPGLGSKSLSELLADGTIRFKVDEKYPQALGINTVSERTTRLRNSTWEILHNTASGSPFFTSDYPVALEETGHSAANWIVPLAPDLAIRIIPDDPPRASPTVAFKAPRYRHLTPDLPAIAEINRLIVRSAEDMIFYRDDLGWVQHFISKNRHYRIEAVLDRSTYGPGLMGIPRQRIVPHRHKS